MGCMSDQWGRDLGTSPCGLARKAHDASAPRIAWKRGNEKGVARKQDVTPHVFASSKQEGGTISNIMEGGGGEQQEYVL